MNQNEQPRYGIDPYLDWVAKEGLPVTEDYGIDLFAVETVDWPRYGIKGAAVHLWAVATSHTLCSTLHPVRPTPQRHLYEEVVYVLEETVAPDRTLRRPEAQFRMGAAQPLRHPAERQASAFQRQRKRAGLDRQHNRPAAGDEHISQ